MRWEGCRPPRPLCDAIGCWVGSCDRCVLLHLMCHLPLRPHWRMFCGAQRVHLMIPREGMVGRRSQDGVSMHGRCKIRSVTVEPLYKGQVGSIVLCLEVVLSSEVTNVLSLWEWNQLVLCSEVVLGGTHRFFILRNWGSWK